MTKKSLTKKEISAIIDLLRVFVPEDEIEEYAEEFDTTLDYDIDELDDLESTSQGIGLINIFKEDEGAQDLSIKKSLEALEGHVVVQRVVRK